MVLFLEEVQIRAAQTAGNTRQQKQPAGPYHPEHIQGNPRLSLHSIHDAMTFTHKGQQLVGTQVEDNRLIFCG